MDEMNPSHTYVGIINYNHLNITDFIGKGSFGVVSKARWNNIDVAVKLIEGDAATKAFKVELKQLSRVSHPNIVKVYGYCSEPKTCLVMEFAEGGSLYNVLHCILPEPEYTISHALSWTLQCAKGVAYLHDMKPKALVHRDLKPPNLLLILGGTVLKICDFGTACDLQTHMTNNKGSAAWMAPEVFEGNSYTEKCDIFSWGIILWEVLARKKPFDESGSTAFRILWAIYQGKRPPMIKNLPPPLEKLMTSCWSSNPMERPPMTEVVRIMSSLLEFYPGHHEPIKYPEVEEENFDDDSEELDEEVCTPTPTPHDPHTHNIAETIRQSLSRYNDFNVAQLRETSSKAGIIEENFKREWSAPASLSTSRESLLEGGNLNKQLVRDPSKRHSVDLDSLDTTSWLDNQGHNIPVKTKMGHRRAGSCGTYEKPLNIQVSPPSVESYAGMLTPEYATGQHLSINDFCDPSILNILQSTIDINLQPFQPDWNSQESRDIYTKHSQMLDTYYKVQIETALLMQRQQELLDECEQGEKSEQSNSLLIDEHKRLVEEHDNLVKYHRQLTCQLNQLRSECTT